MAVAEEDIGHDWAGLWSHSAYGSHSGWILALFVASTLICGLSAAACVCGCRKTRNKHNGGEELHGPKGMIIKTNPDESQGCVNHSDGIPPINDSTVVNIYPDDNTAHETRPLTTAKRSLPDIPVDQLKDGILGDGCKVGSRSVPREMDSLDSNHIKCSDAEIGESGGGTHSGGDTSSDLYATVEDTTRDAGMSALASTSFGSSGKKRIAPVVPPPARPLSNSGHESGNLIDQGISIKRPVDDEEEDDDDDAHSRYSRLNKEHPYDSLKTTEEHPYAQVKTSKSDHGRGLYSAEMNDGRVSSSAAPLPNLKPQTWNECVHFKRHLESNCQCFSPSTFAHSSSIHANGIEGQNPVPPPRAHRRSQSGTSGSCASSPPSVHIPAAKAISGGISANQELPYMTPPINLDSSNPSASALNATVSSSLVSRSLPNGSTPGLETGPGPFQQRGSRGNFHNLESQDSNSYTSISVREPIATIKAQISEQQKNARLPPLRIPSKSLRSTDPHYASVSDDSDEMYAAIGDRSGSSQAIYGSGSETYAQIQPQPLPAAPSASRGGSSPLPGLPSPLPPSASPTPHALLPPSISPVSLTPVSPTSLPCGATLGSQLQPSPPPQPPSVDSLRQVAQVHSRQASSSSATSSTVNLGSPKPEKRQANSPLPPPPLVPTLAVPEVDDEDEIKVFDQPEVELRHEKLPHTPQNLEEMYAKVIKKNKRKSEGSTLQSLPMPVTGNDSTRKSVGSSSPSLIIAAINGGGPSAGRWSETDDHKLSAGATASRRKSSEGSSMTTSDPDLSLDVRLSVALGEEAESESEWGAEGEFRHTDLPSAAPDPSGSRSRGNIPLSRSLVGTLALGTEEGDGSGYESVGSRNGEMAICRASLSGKQGEDDAGYEELKPRRTASSQGDPGYERVKRREGASSVDDDEDDEEEREGEPRYERVSARVRGAVPGYETVRERSSGAGEPDYEKMRGEEEEPNYESVGYSGSLNSGHVSNGPVGDSLHNDYESLAGVSNGDEMMYDGRTSNSPMTAPPYSGIADTSQLDAMYAKVQKGKKNP
ncbi:NHS-like protein 1 [Ischnura elegans]|uniref:NHS-like protein 1 n=1 Tax=Ischnura elegans TaxID=197161 RepID=UPI001ED87EE1|nr:NHS-like protein 1 [Ischnura elegans]